MPQANCTVIIRVIKNSQIGHLLWMLYFFDLLYPALTNGKAFSERIFTLCFFFLITLVNVNSNSTHTKGKNVT
jgi:hypothetical protein